MRNFDYDEFDYRAERRLNRRKHMLDAKRGKRLIKIETAHVEKPAPKPEKEEGEAFPQVLKVLPDMCEQPDEYTAG